MKRIPVFTALLAALVTTSVLAAPAAFAAAPTITSLTPTAGTLNIAVTVHGTNLAGATGAALGGVTATITSDTATAVVIKVPLTAPSGVVTVTTGGGTATSPTSFTVQPGVLPAAAAAPGANIAVNGSGFAPFEAIDVYLDTTAAALVTTGSTGAFTASVPVPASAAPGTHWVSAVGRHSGYAAQKSFAVRTDWSRLGFDPMHTDDNARENTLSTTTVPNLDEEWTVGTGGAVTGPVAEVAGVIYAASADGVVTAVNATTQVQTWSRTLGRQLVASPVVYAGVLYIGTSTGLMYALNSATGATIWSVQLASGVGNSSALVVDSQVYVGTRDGTVYDLSTGAGVTIWSYATGGDVESSPAYYGGSIFVGSSGALFDLDAEDGSLNYRYATAAPVDSAATVAAGRAFFLSEDDYLRGITAETGTGSWDVEERSTSVPLANTPAFGTQVLYVERPDDVVAYFARTGAVDWTSPVDNTGGGYSNVVLANGVVYAGTSGGSLYAFSAATGAQLWAGGTGGAVTGLIVTDGTLTVSDADGSIYRYSLGGAPATVRVGRPRLARLENAR